MLSCNERAAFHIGFGYNCSVRDAGDNTVSFGERVGRGLYVQRIFADDHSALDYCIIQAIVGFRNYHIHSAPQNCNSRHSGSERGAMRYCMEKLCYYGRQIAIGVIIPIRSDGSGIEMPEKFRKIREIARQYNIPTLNLYEEGRILDNSMTPDGTSYYLSDSVHLGANGNIQLQRIIGSWIAYNL